MYHTREVSSSRYALKCPQLLFSYGNRRATRARHKESATLGASGASLERPLVTARWTPSLKEAELVAFGCETASSKQGTAGRLAPLGPRSCKHADGSFSASLCTQLAHHIQLDLLRFLGLLPALRLDRHPTSGSADSPLRLPRGSFLGTNPCDDENTLSHSCSHAGPRTHSPMPNPSCRWLPAASAAWTHCHQCHV
jgi:hypothetical protein